MLFFARSKVDKLQDEVLAGKPVVTLNRSGKVESLVSEVALRILDGNGDILPQIGKFQDGVLKASCQLPGEKHKGKDIGTKDVQLVLEDKVQPLAAIIEPRRADREVKVEVCRPSSSWQ